MLSMMISSVSFLLYTVGLGNPLTSRFNSEKINSEVMFILARYLVFSAYVAAVIVDQAKKK